VGGEKPFVKESFGKGRLDLALVPFNDSVLAGFNGLGFCRRSQHKDHDDKNQRPG